ncbi:hypothetical protein CJ739_1727 [Mariniflexile rhizosphaerae]|uniref:hypothetical protein n=1 Tax=unclassified Mariniflexile TaxID=2643887 RepID=UPI000CC032AA|nr:hypothetical protein [Mariniflexile sp. TRM1-10]AXP80813.1 hypothetical protein CJ739_1727 [Mariniflexile sp. TRM1-10]PLB17653.1 MAG: Type IV pilus biogenesis protein PilN [Flavobacteriaceae bacterium FS1-H7996/R]
MLERFKTYLEYGNRFCGVEHGSHNGQEAFYATVLKKDRKSVSVVDFFDSADFEGMVSKLNKKQPVFLVVNNDSVLTKHIESSQTEASKLMHNAFPNINPEDFFYEIVSQGSSHLLSICRKAYVEGLVLDYKGHGFSVIGISLGNGLVTGIAPFLDSTSIMTSNACLTMNMGAVASIEKKNIEDTVTYDVNGLRANNFQLLSMAAALDIVLERFRPLSNFGILKLSLKNDYKQARFFAVFVRFGLLFILCGLLINFFVFNHYFETVNALQQTSQINQTTKSSLLELSERVNKSQKMVDDMLKGSASKSSFYVDAIVRGLPSSILLTELDYQPLLKRIKSGQSVVIDNNTLLVSGESNDSASFSEWIADMEDIDWIQKVEIINYGDASSSVASFSLKLMMVHD